ncbi:hypothetical protein [Streptosporangium roseum]|uniref:Uncharacterized protein n=1 Tax=Streptosporangium roseum (strain ATCC 12428 / DSM 43021 / JCM 3005 / KCTC 9067 / NCIMB 10171 / NRRL 2505 / NI 9100) TaxID=479432 RepID=D2BFV7_STRRD|nr:hypothetical protein [Streptosporangium roseum]ACZ92009.1 hypothetical protein Sros_9391 [Streptosporangium roseum DSM 43021]
MTSQNTRQTTTETSKETEMADDMAEQHNTHDREAMRQALAESRRRTLGEDAQPADLADVDADDIISGAVTPEGDEDDDEQDEQAASSSDEQAQRIWDEALDGWHREGRDRVHAADLAQLLDTVRRSRRFLYLQVGRWRQMGCLVARPDADGWDLIASPMQDAPAPR